MDDLCYQLGPFYERPWWPIAGYSADLCYHDGPFLLDLARCWLGQFVLPAWTDGGVEKRRAWWRKRILCASSVDAAWLMPTAGVDELCDHRGRVGRVAYEVVRAARRVLVRPRRRCLPCASPAHAVRCYGVDVVPPRRRCAGPCIPRARRALLQPTRSWNLPQALDTYCSINVGRWYRSKDVYC